MKTYFCGRCDVEAPFLDEAEWKSLEPYAISSVHAIKDFRAKHGVSLAEAKAAVEVSIVEEFEKLTGFRLPSWACFYHHRLSQYGKECDECGQLFRTPRAKHCVYCGWAPRGAA